MNRARRFAGLAVVLAVIMTGVGCNDPRDQQIIALQEQNDDLSRQNADLLNRLNECMNNTDAQRARILDLQARLANAQSQPVTIQQPAQAEGWTREGGVDSITFGADILFDPGRDALTSPGRAKLNEIAGQIRSTYMDREIWIVGHTDSDPIRYSKAKYQDNLDLSLNRAATVFREMQSLGLEPTQLVAAGQGEFKPVASNSDKAGKAQNRRVEIMAIVKPR
ncbi:MAG: OmpA family protein [Phycisphaerae bacterium]|nr:OmpA family protein [Phycisphaerae bacterium]